MPASSIQHRASSIQNRYSAIGQSSNTRTVLIWQVAASFAVWLVFGYFQARKAPELRRRMATVPRRRRVTLGPIMMIVGAVILLAGLGLVAAIHGIQNGSLTPIAWIVATLAGGMFVQTQITSAVMMLSVATENEPGRIPGASDGRINDRKLP